MDAKVTLLDRMTFVGVSDSGQQVKMDSSVAAGGDGSAARPIELIAMALGGCTAMDVISILRKKQQEVTFFEVQLHMERAEQHPKVFTSAILTYDVRGRDVDPAALLRAIQLSVEKYCPAHAMLSKAFPMEILYRISDEAGNLVSEGPFEPALV